MSGGSSEWIHCNKCFRTPPNSNGMPFYFSQCGHILCRKCITTAENKPATACPTCNKTCTFAEVNRNLKPEIQQFFRNPTELAASFMSQLKRVLEFQSNNRMRLVKHINEKSQKMQKFIEGAQTEMKRRAEATAKIEQKNLEERKKWMLEVENLKMKLAAAEEEVKRFRSGTPTISRGDSGFSSGLEMSFQEFVTSTPIQGPSPNDHKRPRSTERRRGPDFFADNGNKLSPIAQDPLSTPALLGLNKKTNRRSNSGGRSGGGDFKLGVDVDMGGF